MQETSGLQSEGAGQVLRFFRTVYAICPECGSGHGYDPGSRKVVLQKRESLLLAVKSKGKENSKGLS